jgi:hypothetical protein
VYEALLRVIKNTNEGATHNYNAPIRTIETLDIGKQAAESWEKSMRQGDETFFAKIAPDTKKKRKSPGAGGRRRESKVAPDDPVAAAVDRRYVSDKGEPISARSGGKVDHPYAEFKMMPVYMELDMNQTKIPKLLAECANSNMPIEVRRVRFGEAVGRGTSDLSRPSSGGGGPTGSAVPAEAESDPLQIPVQIYGIICIYNPPDSEKLGTGKAADSLADSSPATGATAEPSGGMPRRSPGSPPIRAGQ